MQAVESYLDLGIGTNGDGRTLCRKGGLQSAGGAQVVPDRVDDVRRLHAPIFSYRHGDGHCEKPTDLDAHVVYPEIRVLGSKDRLDRVSLRPLALVERGSHRELDNDSLGLGCQVVGNLPAARGCDALAGLLVASLDWLHRQRYADTVKVCLDVNIGARKLPRHATCTHNHPP